jgi:hypothetical protein
MSDDNFSAGLDCPKCHRKGTVGLSEADGWAYMRGEQTTRVRSLPDGFKVVKQASHMGSIDIYCADCNVSALEGK